MAAQTYNRQARRPFRGRLNRLLAGAFAVAAALLWVFVVYCYGRRPDSCALVTNFPAWVWFLVGGFLVLGSRIRGARRRTVVLVFLWLTYLALWVPECRSLLRRSSDPPAEWTAARARGEALRVVSLNCAARNEAAAAEVVALSPDIVLLQEAPTRPAVTRLAHRLFGDHAVVVWTWECAIITRGKVEWVLPHRTANAYFARARVRLPSGIAVELISLHLVPNSLDVDISSSQSWHDAADNRRARREQTRTVAAQLRTIPPEVPIILGGDFNAPAGDASYDPLRPRLRDTFVQAGRGWGNTIFNDYPLHRIDQIWVSRDFRPASVVARRTVHSDHRMVIADLIMRSP
jgi:endonuclease/exonuclease/phosphatase family metal-dependent hydrolase